LNQLTKVVSSGTFPNEKNQVALFRKQGRRSPYHTGLKRAHASFPDMIEEESHWQTIWTCFTPSGQIPDEQYIVAMLTVIQMEKEEFKERSGRHMVAFDSIRTGLIGAEPAKVSRPSGSGPYEFCQNLSLNLSLKLNINRFE
jgi:hypothetical protein